MDDDELLRRQDRLCTEADRVAGDLGLDALLSGVGRPVRVGSAALALMTGRDLDIDVVCARLTPATATAVAAIGARLAVHERVREVTFRDDTGHWNTDPRYPDGLYLGVRCRSREGHDWTLDIWFVDRPDRQPSHVHLRTLPPRLTPATRLAVLRLKHTLAGHPARGYDVYRAVLDHGVRTPGEFERWYRERPSADT
ncbi:hypothetical protein [Streptantibioticus cattleyicolor]|nr:hypothetical protein [Streptantibioticus cattleyicolor]CCB71795.1 conserved protein of unknown function [Streptantibioticus cattleyicolor NRRL 8057 = DSM 46488]